MILITSIFFNISYNMLLACDIYDINHYHVIVLNEINFVISYKKLKF